MLSEVTASMQRALVLIGTVYLFFTIAIAIVLCIASFFIARLWVKFVEFRNRREVVCPETGGIAVIRIDALHAAVSSAVSDPDLHVRGCSRWPARRDCGQQCLAHLRA